MRSRTNGMWWGSAIEAPEASALAHLCSRPLDWLIGHEEPATAIVAAADGPTFLVETD